jgi:hypothetical protein
MEEWRDGRVEGWKSGRMEERKSGRIRENFELQDLYRFD